MTEPLSKLSHVATLSPEETATALERIAAGLRRGRLHLTADGTEVHLRPTRSVRFELHVRAASVRAGGRLDVDMSWTRLPAEPGKNGSGNAGGSGGGANGHARR